MASHFAKYCGRYIYVDTKRSYTADRIYKIVDLIYFYRFRFVTIVVKRYE